MTYYIHVFIPFNPVYLAVILGILLIFVVFFAIKYVIGFYTGA